MLDLLLFDVLGAWGFEIAVLAIIFSTFSKMRYLLVVFALVLLLDFALLA